jgi:hypothetical protein
MGERGNENPGGPSISFTFHRIPKKFFPSGVPSTQHFLFISKSPRHATGTPVISNRDELAGDSL